MSLEFVDIHHAFGDLEVLQGITLTAEPGEITCLLGPSGCGKTTLLRLTAGLLQVQQGEVRLHGQALAAPNLHPAPEKRPVGLVFQEGALFPHMNVAQNIGFGVKKGAGHDQLVKDLLQQIGLPGSEKKYPDTLSGGQQQRVALARALAPEPPVLLLDEPFGSVDVVLRRQLREETRRMLRSREAIAVLVTHDPEEALEISDRIAVMGMGTILQCDRPGVLYDAPVSADVAVLFGNGQKLRVQRTGEGVRTPFGVWPQSAFSNTLPGSREIDLVTRPEALDLQPGDSARVEDVRPQGPMQRVIVVSTTGDRLAALVRKGVKVEVGQSVDVVPLEKAIFGYPT